MKPHRFFPYFSIALAFIVVIAACSRTETDPRIDHYTCPMHPQIIKDEPGDCPICGMKLVPVYKEGMDPHDEGHVDGAKEERREDVDAAGKSVVIPASGQELAGIATATVARREVVKSVRTFGRVAFDPELSVAQTDYLAALGTAPELKSAARRRLKLLGMSDAEIAELERTRKSATNLYLPDASSPPWVYATLYEDDVPFVMPATPVTVTVPSLGGKTYEGKVVAVDPVVDPAARTLRARIELDRADASLKLGTSVDVTLHVPLGDRLVVPKSAVLNTGERSLVYLVNGTRFTPVSVVTGPDLEDDVVVSEGLKEGDIVAAKALFLVDSEARLRGTE